MQIEPQTPLPAVYLIPNHTDPDIASYYVRAVIRDSLSHTTLDTVSLSYESNGRYAGQFNAPADTTGLGRQIDVTVSVYTDSGYTTKSENYGDTIEKWYVKAQQFFGGSGGGGEIDYKKIRQMIREVVSALFEENKPTPVNLSGIETALSAVKQWTEAFTFPEVEKPEKLNLAPVLAAQAAGLAQILKAISDKEIPELDLTPVLDDLDELSNATKRLDSKTHELLARGLEQIGREVQEILKEALAANSKENAKRVEAAKALLDTPPEKEPAEKTPKKENPLVSKYFPVPTS